MSASGSVVTREAHLQELDPLLLEDRLSCKVLRNKTTTMSAGYRRTECFFPGELVGVYFSRDQQESCVYSLDFSSFFSVAPPLQRLVTAIHPHAQHTISDVERGKVCVSALCTITRRCGHCGPQKRREESGKNTGKMRVKLPQDLCGQSHSHSLRSGSLLSTCTEWCGGVQLSNEAKLKKSTRRFFLETSVLPRFRHLFASLGKWILSFLAGFSSSSPKKRKVKKPSDSDGKSIFYPLGL